MADVVELLAPADTRALRRLMAVCAHRPVKYVPECLLRNMLRVGTQLQRSGYVLSYSLQVPVQRTFASRA
jgi:hypothetical protein